MKSRVTLLAILPLLLITGCATQKARINVKEIKPTDAEYQSFQQDMCKQVMCQYNVKVTLKRKDGTLFDKQFDSMPVVQENGVMVIAGQTVAFEADIKEGMLSNLKLVETITNPEKTFTAKLEQSPEGNMMLSLKNPFNKHVRIHMGMMPLDKDDLYQTSSCPVIAKGGSYEMWPYPIFQVWLGDLRLMNDDEDMICKE